MSVQSMGEMRKDFCPNVLLPFLENIDRRSCNDGSWELMPVFHNPHRKCRPSPSAVAHTLEYLEGVQVNIQKALEYDGNDVTLKSSPLLGMKAQSLQFLFGGEVMHASYQPCSLSLNSL